MVRRRKVRNCPEFINRIGTEFESWEKAIRRGVESEQLPLFYGCKKKDSIGKERNPK